MIRLLLADDQALVRGAMAALLGMEPDLDVVAEALGGTAGDRRTGAEPDVVSGAEPAMRAACLTSIGCSSRLTTRVLVLWAARS